MATVGELEASDEMNALVAEKVFGCRPLRCEPPLYGETFYRCGCPHGNHNIQEGNAAGQLMFYSTDWGFAGIILDHFEAKDYGKVRLTGSKYHGWYCTFVWGPGLDGEGEATEPVFGVTGPEAICRAALKAVGCE